MNKPADPTVDEIDRVARNLVVRKRVHESSGQHAVADCPWCGRQGKLYLNLETGLGDCKHAECAVGERGFNLWRLADQLGVRLREKRLVRSTASVIKTSLRKVSAPVKTTVSAAKIDAAERRLWNSDDPDGAKVLAYLRARGIDDAAIRHFRLGAVYIKTDAGEAPAVGIPFFAGADCVLLKIRNADDACDHADRFRRTAGGESAMLNVAGVYGRRRVVMMEGELDAISVWQCGVTEVCSTSLGAKKDVPETWKEALADAEDVVLWYDEDEAGQAAVEALVVALGTHRCRIARIPDALADEVEKRTGKRPKDANDLVRAGVPPEQVRGVVDSASPIEVGSVTHMSAFQSALDSVISQGVASLGESTGFRSLDDLLRGWRPGEVTGITGHTGQGKSTFGTFLGELIAHRGVPVLLSAFEDGPIALAHKAFRRRFGRSISSLVTDQDKAEAIAALPRLAEDPIYVIDAFGRVRWQDVVDAIRYAVLRLKVRWVLVDHLHFFARDPKMDGHEHMEKLVMDLAALAVELQIHIAVIIHPNGAIEETVIPTGDSLKGSSALKQCLSNGTTVFRFKHPTGEVAKGKVKVKDASGRRMEIDLGADEIMVYVWKKRHPDAKEGMTVLRFDTRRTSYHEVVQGEQSTLPGTEPRDAFSDDAAEPDLFGGTQ